MLKRIGLVLTGIFAITFPTPAVASDGFWDVPLKGHGNVYVTSGLGHTWRSVLHNGVLRIDRYTGSHLLEARCRNGARCIRLVYGNVKGTAMGYTACHAGNCTITIERGTPVRYRPYLIAHELGHANGLRHNARPVSIMYPYRTYWTDVSRIRYTRAEQSILARN